MVTGSYRLWIDPPNDEAHNELNKRRACDTSYGINWETLLLVSVELTGIKKKKSASTTDVAVNQNESIMCGCKSIERCSILNRDGHSREGVLDCSVQTQFDHVRANGRKVVTVLHFIDEWTVAPSPRYDILFENRHIASIRWDTLFVRRRLWLMINQQQQQKNEREKKNNIGLATSRTRMGDMRSTLLSDVYTRHSDRIINIARST